MAASRSLGQLTLDLVARIGGFVGPLDKAARASKKSTEEIQKSAKAAGVAIAAGETVAATAVTAMVTSSIKAADEANNLSKAAGITVESFTGLQFAANQSNVETGELVAAFSRLNKGITEAAFGTEKQAELFKSLGVSVRDASGEIRAGDDVLLDLADRFKGLPDGAQKSALAIELFGKSGAKLLPFLSSGSDGIRELTAQAERLGLVISGEQAAAAEQFNDNLDVLAAVSRGAGNAMAAELLPSLNELSGLLIDVAEDSNAAATSATVLAGVLKTLATAGLVIGAAFETTGQAVGAASAAIAAAAQGEFSQAWEIAKAGVTDYADTTTEAIDRINKLWSGDFAAAGKQAAEVAAVVRTSVDRQTKAQKDASKEAEILAKKLEEQVASLEIEAATLGKTTEQIKLYELSLNGATKAQIERAAAAVESIIAFEKQKKAQEEYTQLVTELRSEEEKLTDQVRERLKVLEAVKGLTDAQRADAQSRIAAAGFTETPKFAGLAPEVGGAFGELNKIDDAQAKLEDWYATQLEMLDSYRAQRRDLTAVWDEQELALKQQHETALAGIEQARQLAQLSAAQSTFGELADLTKTFAGEQSGIYKIMFAAQKGFAIAQSLIAIQQGIAQAAANPFPANLAAMATVAAATASIIGNIQAVGMAHDGIDSVPQDGTWLLQKGERVTTAETSAKLDQTLANIQAGMGGSGAGGKPVQVTVNMPGITNAREARQASGSVQRAIAQGVGAAARFT